MSKLAEAYAARTGHYPTVAGWKESGTSREAAAAVSNASLLRDRVLEVLRRIGPSTADEVAAIMGKTVLAIRPLFSELLRLGKIEKTGERRCNASGRAAWVWRVR